MNFTCICNSAKLQNKGCGSTESLYKAETLFLTYIKITIWKQELFPIQDYLSGANIPFPTHTSSFSCTCIIMDTNYILP